MVKYDVGLALIHFGDTAQICLYAKPYGYPRSKGDWFMGTQPVAKRGQTCLCYAGFGSFCRFEAYYADPRFATKKPKIKRAL
ncbi:MAG: hypothetical protein H6633_31605 [Anaerolineales bacterium]|nr:hypothetical protein [Anaerolineales bacterium]